MKKDMFYFADIDYKFLLANKDTPGFEDGCLVFCEQMIEKVLKGLLREENGEYPNKHNLRFLLSKCSFVKKYKSYLPLCSELTDCYFERRCESDEYYAYSNEDYLDIVNKSIEFYNYLLTERKNYPTDRDYIKKSDSFNSL